MERLVVPWFIPRGRSHPWESPGGSSVPRALSSSLLSLRSEVISVVSANSSTTWKTAARATPLMLWSGSTVFSCPDVSSSVSRWRSPQSSFCRGGNHKKLFALMGLRPLPIGESSRRQRILPAAAGCSAALASAVVAAIEMPHASTSS